ncbi:large Ala/Glu-rich protein [Streptomyces sp. NRRL F-6628]|uniref:large Ala/Glu-rich protein n=1 Tax=Streptomyces sp. NRRL F-6628 TaxID=1463876 RepID=UPI000563E1E0|nr:large Ala/Glu-rich protein [Streptomyces sp. NRRL F-6628]
MATKPATRRQRPAAHPKPRNRRAKAPQPPASPPAHAAAPEETVPLVFPEADPVLADAAERAADLRDQAADDAARILSDGRALATELLDSARTEAASITEAAIAERSRLLAAAATDADRVRTEAATTAAADADQVRAAAEAAAEQLLAEARTEAGTVRTTTAGEAEQVLADAKATVEQLLADANRQAQEVTTRAAAQAERVRGEAKQAAAKALADAERTAAQTRTRASTDADQLLEQARSEADRLRESAGAQAAQVKAGAEKAAAELREDATREREASRADAARTRALAKEDIGRLRATAAEDAERLTRTARQEADRLLAVARAKRDAELKEAEQALVQARLREADADVALKSAEDLAAEAAAEMKRATDRTERALERKRLKLQAKAERRDTREARKAKARELRAESRAGKPAVADRVKKFVKVNAERLMVIGPITAPMAVAWTGQAGFAEDILGWVVPFTILFAAAWELSTAFVGWMYHQARQSGDAGTLYRVSTWIFALGAAVMNFWHASGEPVAGSRVWDAQAEIWTEQITYWHFTPKAVAFAAMSIVGMVLWELYASLIHRRKLREDGKVAKARPSIGAVRWVRYPVHSFMAWSLAITDPRLTTLDRAWTAAGAQLADRKAVRTGRALHRVVVPRVGADDHGPAAIPTVLTLTRMDRTGSLESCAAVRPVQHGGHPVRSGPADRNAVHGPVRTVGAADRTGGPALALEAGPAGPQGADLLTGPGPDRGSQAVPAAQKAAGRRGVTVRTADAVPGPQDADRTGPASQKTPSSASGPDRGESGGPDRTVITLTDQERAALDRLRTDGEPLNRANIAKAVRTEGGSIATDRAGQIAVALKQHTVR